MPLLCYRFSKYEDLKQKWLHALKRDNFKASSSSRICSKYFKIDYFDKNVTAYKKRQSAAVASAFKSFPMHLQRNVQRVKPPKKRNIVNPTCSNVIENSTVTQNSDTHVIECHAEVDTPRKVTVKQKLAISYERLLTASKKN